MLFRSEVLHGARNRAAFVTAMAGLEAAVGADSELMTSAQGMFASLSDAEPSTQPAADAPAAEGDGSGTVYGGLDFDLGFEVEEADPSSSAAAADGASSSVDFDLATVDGGVDPGATGSGNVDFNIDSADISLDGLDDLESPPTTSGDIDFDLTADGGAEVPEEATGTNSVDFDLDFGEEDFAADAVNEDLKETAQLQADATSDTGTGDVDFDPDFGGGEDATLSPSEDRKSTRLNSSHSSVSRMPSSA